MGFEPTRAEPIGLAVQRLNHSATSSLSPGAWQICTRQVAYQWAIIWLNINLALTEQWRVSLTSQVQA